MCTLRRLRSAWASAQSDQRLRCPQEESLGAKLSIDCREDSDQTGQMPRLIQVFTVRTCHFVGFVMRWLIYCYYVSTQTGLSKQCRLHQTAP